MLYQGLQRRALREGLLAAGSLQHRLLETRKPLWLKWVEIEAARWAIDSLRVYFRLFPRRGMLFRQAQSESVCAYLPVFVSRTPTHLIPPPPAPPTPMCAWLWMLAGCLSGSDCSTDTPSEGSFAASKKKGFTLL